MDARDPGRRRLFKIKFDVEYLANGRFCRRPDGDFLDDGELMDTTTMPVKEAIQRLGRQLVVKILRTAANEIERCDELSYGA
jgi:hypothetical protein